jgi:hypothetical protein
MLARTGEGCPQTSNFQWNEAKVLSAVLSLDMLAVELLLKP